MNAHVKPLQVVLANSYALQLKAQNFHWNVEGRHFSQLHALFEEQYDALSDAVDEIAERIRTLGAKIDGSFKGFSALKTVADAPDGLDENGMVQNLLEGHHETIKTIREALHAAEEAGDDFTVDMMVARTGAHEKAAWMLRSSLKDEVRGKESAAARYDTACDRSVKNCA